MDTAVEVVDNNQDKRTKGQESARDYERPDAAVQGECITEFARLEE